MFKSMIGLAEDVEVICVSKGDDVALDDCTGELFACIIGSTGASGLNSELMSIVGPNALSDT